MIDIPQGTRSEWLSRGQEPFQTVTRGAISCTSNIPGVDLVSGLAPDDPAEQFRLAFENLVQVLARAGRSPTNVVLLEVTITSRDLRQFIDAPWLALFPDAASRPARKTNQRPLPGNLCVQLHAVCIDGSPRPLEIDGLRHRAPIPMGAQAGSYVFSSVIGGEDPASGELIVEQTAQIRQAFANCAALMRAAGSDETAINHMWVFLPDRTSAAPMLEAYLAMFPDPASRPARKTIHCALPEGCAIQIQPSGCTAGRQANFEVAGFAHHDPIPLASRAGNLLQSSGIHGLIPGTRSIAPGGLDRQAELALQTVLQLMDNAGGSLADIAGLTVLVQSLGHAAQVHQTIMAYWGGLAIPAIRFAQQDLPAEMVVQFHLTAWLS